MSLRTKVPLILLAVFAFSAGLDSVVQRFVIYPSFLALERDEALSSVSGILQTARGPMLVSARPIVTSQNQGPIRGTFIMGRFLSEQLVRTLAEHAHVQLELFPLQGEGVPVERWHLVNRATADAPFVIVEYSPTVLHTHAVVRDISGVPLLLLQATTAREISARGAVATRFAQVSMVAVAALVVIVTLVALQVVVVRPIAGLTQDVVAIGARGDLEARLSCRGDGEVGTLAQEFNRMLEQLAGVRQKLLEQSHYAGRAEMVAAVLHNVRNELSPISARIATLAQRMRGVCPEQLEAALTELSQGEMSPERHEDLARFVSLTAKHLAALPAEVTDELARVSARMGQVEHLMAAHERFARAERVIQPVSLEALLGDATRLVAAGFHDEVRFEIEPSVSQVGLLRTDRIALLEAFVGLLVKAVGLAQDAEGSSPTVRIGAGIERRAAGEMVHVRVHCDGMQLAGGDVRRFFERAVSGGTGDADGLGLHWSANTIQAMNGELYAESEARDNGACFHVLFPRDAAPGSGKQHQHDAAH